MDNNGRAPLPGGVLAPNDNAAAFYDLTPNHMEATISRKAANSLRKGSKQASLTSEIEVQNKTNCLRFEKTHAESDQHYLKGNKET